VLVRIVAFGDEHGTTDAVHAACPGKRGTVVSARGRNDSHRTFRVGQVRQQVDRTAYLESADVLHVFELHEGLCAEPLREERVLLQRRRDEVRPYRFPCLHHVIDGDRGRGCARVGPPVSGIEGVVYRRRHCLFLIESCSRASSGGTGFHFQFSSQSIRLRNSAPTFSIGCSRSCCTSRRNSGWPDLLSSIHWRAKLPSLISSS